MSENFTGVTFAKQKVTPSYDAIVRRALLSDGTLTGCDISYSGSTLTMAAGQLMVCGRQIIHPSAQNWAVTEATSGYARLVLTIDLTRTSTKDTFDQVVDSIQYATDADGFVALEQTDINTSGTVYQVAVCVVSLGTGGITGIVSQLEKSEGGAALNFKVVGSPTAPGLPTENTIWCKTSVPISQLFIDGVTWAPDWSAEQGTVYLGYEAGVGAPGADNALLNIVKLRGNMRELLAKLTACHQNQDGTASGWERMDAYIYKSGTWVQFSKSSIFLYDNGDKCESLGGAWVTKGMAIDSSATAQAAPTVTWDANSVTITQNSVAGGFWYKEQKIDLTDVSAIRLKGKFPSAINREDYITLFVKSSLDDYAYQNNTAQMSFGTAAGDKEKTLDVSSLSGSYYVGLYIFNTGSMTIYEIELVMA